MEEDRPLADLGPDVSTEINAEEETVEKKPKRRFIGRKAADAKAAAKAQEDGGGIEDSGAVQGPNHTSKSLHTHNMLMEY
jgi:2-(3-amino-3-carboxypropyl)histidine synthase